MGTWPSFPAEPALVPAQPTPADDESFPAEDPGLLEQREAEPTRAPSESVTHSITRNIKMPLGQGLRQLVARQQKARVRARKLVFDFY